MAHSVSSHHAASDVDFSCTHPTTTSYSISVTDILLIIKDDTKTFCTLNESNMQMSPEAVDSVVVCMECGNCWKNWISIEL